MSYEQRLKELGIELPEAPRPVGAYVTWQRTGNLVTTSGQLPWVNRVMQYPGRLGAEVNTEEGYGAARIAGLNALAQLKQALGSLDNVAKIVRLEGYVHCTQEFREHPRVLDGCSDLLVSVFGDAGLHTRIALGVYAMPLEACVQLVVWAEAR